MLLGELCGLAEGHQKRLKKEMGLSENRVPLNPMVNDHYPY